MNQVGLVMIEASFHVFGGFFFLSPWPNAQVGPHKHQLSALIIGAPFIYNQKSNEQDCTQ